MNYTSRHGGPSLTSSTKVLVKQVTIYGLQVNQGLNKYLSPRSPVITCRLHNQTTIDEAFIIMSTTKLII
jgi:hypothetical protein